MSNDERRRLTPRELEFVAMAVQGLPNKHIARACGVSDRTVMAAFAFLAMISTLVMLAVLRTSFDLVQSFAGSGLR
ncbi:LuxR C-terminal-related transcriptional regulator [Brevundimonas sp. 2R-24]|uniref:LuxR C-terminal-related transcriptional regulator n=1 Tax=Peiella sedimenti TaxID=3061083 RepID=A0ABT8SI95_9CAUL|nr:LuxR C-terminal-related transcriptional regulator [Caulobacteraceae bacterium XZ-24]